MIGSRIQERDKKNAECYVGDYSVPAREQHSRVAPSVGGSINALSVQPLGEIPEEGRRKKIMVWFCNGSSLKWSRPFQNSNIGNPNRMAAILFRFPMFFYKMATILFQFSMELDKMAAIVFKPKCY